MSFFKSLFGGKKDSPINSYTDFWQWFQQHQQRFYQVVKEKSHINKEFFQKIAPKLNELQDGYWYQAGMHDVNTAELILTADGVIKNIVFVEELVAAAPKMNRWKFTALKQPSSNVGIMASGFEFSDSILQFYPIKHHSMPDEIDITITHPNYNEENQHTIANGVLLALDNYLGELNAVTTIDQLNIIHPNDATEDLIPLSKLKDFLVWREKEFVEKYHGLRYDTENDNYSGLEATLSNGLPMLAILNRDLLHWDRKASHPWIAVLVIQYQGNKQGMPDDPTYQLLNEIEDQVMIQLKDSEGYLNVVRKTADSTREVYFACIDFRKPAKVLQSIKKKYQDWVDVDYELYKDKYWQSFQQFINN